MHRIAEYGIITQIQDTPQTSGTHARQAAHRADLQWLRNLLAWQAHTPSAEFLDSLQVDLHSAGGRDLHPGRGRRPASGRRDRHRFCYALDADAGHRAVSALTNGRLSPMRAPLEDGQVIEILTAAETESGPSEVWLEAGRTGHARVHIAQWLADRRTETAGLAGQRLVADALTSRGENLLDLESGGTMLQLCTELGYPNLETLYAAVAANTVTVDKLIGHLSALQQREAEEAAALEDDDVGE